jgi:nicotinamide riboside kinase
MIRRINLLGGPGSGKTALAAKLFGELAAEGHEVEHVGEYIKKWAYQGRHPISFDQLYIFAQQLHQEDVKLQHVKHIITDSPILLPAVYAKQYGFKGWERLLGFIEDFESEFPSLNIILDRTGIKYVDKGRYQTLETAIEIDGLIRDMVKCCIPYERVHVMPTKDFVAIKELVVSKIK